VEFEGIKRRSAELTFKYLKNIGKPADRRLLSSDQLRGKTSFVGAVATLFGSM
jgi:hypothetical protein